MTDVLVRDEREATGGERLWGFAVAPHGQAESTPLLSVNPLPHQSGHGLTGVIEPIRVLKPVSSCSYTPTSGAESLAQRVSQVLSRLVSMLAETTPSQSVGGSSVARALARIRMATGLRMTDLAEVLGVSRRTLYSWIERGSMSDDGQRRLAGVEYALEPLIGVWPAGRMRLWLLGGEPRVRSLLSEGKYAEVRDLAIEASKPAGEVRRAHRVPADAAMASAPIGELDDATRGAVLATFSQARRPNAAPAVWIPPEITGMGDDYDE